MSFHFIRCLAAHCPFQSGRDDKNEIKCSRSQGENPSLSGISEYDIVVRGSNRQVDSIEFRNKATNGSDFIDITQMQHRHTHAFANYECLTHWGRLTHICVNKLTSIGWDNGLSPGRRQAIIWTNVGILLIGPLGTNFSEILIRILTFSF